MLTSRTRPTSGSAVTAFTPFPPDRAAVYRAAGYWTGQPLDAILTSAAAQWPDHPAVIDDRTSLTYAELDKRANAVAAGLLARYLRLFKFRGGHQPNFVRSCSFEHVHLRQ